MLGGLERSGEGQESKRKGVTPGLSTGGQHASCEITIRLFHVGFISDGQGVSCPVVRCSMDLILEFR